MIELGKGWVPISRQLQDHWLWNDKPFSKGQAWIDLIMLANHEEVKKPYKNQITTFERGTVSLSYQSYLTVGGGADTKCVIS